MRTKGDVRRRLLDHAAANGVYLGAASRSSDCGPSSRATGAPVSVLGAASLVMVQQKIVVISDGVEAA
jgi:hypothetical protein